MSAPAPLPPPLDDGTHLLHVGPQKTGSTSLQMALHAARDELARLGVHYPGPTRKPAGDFGMRPVPGDSARVPSDAPSWQRLRAAVAAGGSGTRVVAVSLEAWGRADDEGARRVVAEVGGRRPHVLAVARRHDRLMPSQWQQRVKSSALRLDYEAWLRLVLGPPRPEEPEWRAVWLPHDTVGLVGRWTAAAGRGAMTLVVPGDDRTLLAATVGALLDVPAALATSDVVRNESLAWPTAELLRRVHVLTEERGWTDEVRETLVREGLVRALARSAEVREAGGDPVPAPPRWALERLAELGEERVAGLRAAVDAGDLRVVGDLEQLRVPAPGPEVDDDLPDPGEVPVPVLVTAVATLATLNADAEKALAALDPAERDRMRTVGRRVSRRTVRRARRQDDEPGR